MTTETSPLNRQPTALDYSSPTQFRFLINQLPKVQYFTTEANIPGITLSDVELGSPLKNIPLLGSKLDYEDLTITFIVDENLENYIEMHTWLTAIGFQKIENNLEILEVQHQIPKQVQEVKVKI